MLAKLAQYPTFQVFIALAFSMILVALSIPGVIRVLRRLHIGQQVRVDGPQRHIVEKQGTPTMGGVSIIVISVIVFFIMTLIAWPEATVKASRLAHFTTGFKGALVVLFLLLACGALGFVDDYSKVAHKRSLGLTPTAKLIGQTTIALITILLAINWVGISADIQIPATSIHIPLDAWQTTVTLGSLTLNFPWLYLIFASIMLVGMSNAVNLTDGLDGLAAGTVMIVMIVFGAIAYSQNSLPLALIASSITGGCIGFLWWNSHPADIFMGDTGSLALGGALGALAMVTKTELLILILGGIFVAEALSVVIQVLVFKRTGKRVFRMAPIHHHFEQKGWSETKVTIRFWIVTAIFAGLGFAIYFFQTTRLGG